MQDLIFVYDKFFAYYRYFCLSGCMLQIGKRAVGWREADIDAWIKARARGARRRSTSVEGA